MAAVVGIEATGIAGVASSAQEHTTTARIRCAYRRPKLTNSRSAGPGPGPAPFAPSGLLLSRKPPRNRSDPPESSGDLAGGLSGGLFGNPPADPPGVPPGDPPGGMPAGRSGSSVTPRPRPPGSAIDCRSIDRHTSAAADDSVCQVSVRAAPAPRPGGPAHSRNALTARPGTPTGQGDRPVLRAMVTRPQDQGATASRRRHRTFTEPRTPGLLPYGGGQGCPAGVARRAAAPTPGGPRGGPRGGSYGGPHGGQRPCPAGPEDGARRAPHPWRTRSDQADSVSAESEGTSSPCRRGREGTNTR